MRRAFLLLMAVLCIAPAAAQASRSNKKKVVTVDTIPFKGRWAFRTNAADWAFTLPNAAVEFDLGSHVNSKQTVGVGFKYNGNTRHKYLPATMFNVTDLRGEWRQYFRTEPNNIQRADTLKVSFFTRLKEDVFTRKRKQPRYWRAYYYGAYLHGGNYSIKLGKKGHKGTYLGVGGSFGFTTPLYAYANKSAVDFEMGASMGFIYTNSDVFTHDPESNCYPVAEHKGGHLVPYPVVTDLRVAFVYRFVSVRDKYKKEDTPRQAARKDARKKRALEREAINDSVNRAREAAQAAEQKQLELQLRQQADSMGISVDSLKNSAKGGDVMKDLRRALRDKEKADKAAARLREKEAKQADKAAKQAEKAARKREEEAAKQAQKEAAKSEEPAATGKEEEP